MTLVQDRNKIKKYHHKLSEVIKSHGVTSRRKLYIATPGGDGELKIYHNPQNNFWWSDGWGEDDGRYYNIFGLDPDYDGTNYILIQINYQKEFSSFSTGALWAEDSLGQPYLLHSGKMGGGVEGFTMDNIDKLYAGSRSTLLAFKKEFEYYTVCRLNSPRAYQQLIAFVRQIEDIKGIIKGTNESKEGIAQASKFTWKDYTPEFWGKRQSYFTKDKHEPDVDHGYLVDCLKEELESNYVLKGKIKKNKWVDLGIVKNGKAQAIFEVKTSTNMQAIYTAVGQLMLHALSSNSHPLKYIVLPDTLMSEIEEDLRNLEITSIRYEWRGTKPVFFKLTQHFKFN